MPAGAAKAAEFRWSSTRWSRCLRSHVGTDEGPQRNRVGTDQEPRGLGAETSHVGTDEEPARNL